MKGWIHMKKNKKLVLALFVFVITTLLIACIVNFNTIRTLLSIKQISSMPAYEMKRYGTYYLDDYLQVGAKNTDELGKFITNKLTLGIVKYHPDDYNCSAFFARTPDGDLIMARNYDTQSARPFIITTDGTDGSKIIGLSNGRFVMQNKSLDPTMMDKIAFTMCPYFMVDGMNEHGLTYALFSVDGSKACEDKKKITLISHTTCATLLNKAKNVKEAVELLSKYNVAFFTGGSSHYMLCDADGNSAIVEYVDGKMQVTHNKKGNYMICSNFMIYNNKNLIGFGKDRYLNYQDALEKTKGVITIEKAFELLKKNTINGQQQWSVIYNITKKTVSVTFSRDYDNIYTYSFE